MSDFKGRFISLEGTEGVGKSTNLAFIREKLESRGIDVLQTREPGGTPLAENIRELLLANREEIMDEKAELLLMFAARSQHLKRVIEPALREGKWVLSDRFHDATFAYQGCGRGVDTDVIEVLMKLVQGGLKPDHTILLDIDVATGLKRASARGEPDRFEREEIAFFERVRQGYLSRRAQEPQRITLIDASQSLVQVQQQLDQALDRILDADALKQKLTEKSG